MRWHGIRLEIVALALVITLGSIWGVQWLYGNFNFQKPLEQKLAQEQFVAEYEIEQQNDTYNIIVIPAHTDNLIQSYQQLYNAVQQVMGAKKFTVHLDNQLHSALDQIATRGQFAIYEAISTGNYTAMENQLNQLAQTADIQSMVFIDQQNIYWQLEKDTRFVYHIISRQNEDDSRPYSAIGGR